MGWASKHTKSCFLLGCFLVVEMAPIALAREMTELVDPGPPRFAIQIPQDLASCLRDPENPEGYLQRNSRWEIKCPIEDLLSKAHRIPSKGPALRLQIADVIYWDLDRRFSALKEQQSALVKTDPVVLQTDKSSEKAATPDTQIPNDVASDVGLALEGVAPTATPSAGPKLDVPELVNWTLFLKDRGQGGEGSATASPAVVSPAPKQENMIEAPGELRAQADKLLKETQFWLDPLYAGDRANVLGYEAAFRHLKILAVAQRFDEVRSFLEKHSNLLFGKKAFEDRIVRDVSTWYERSHNAALGEWLVAKLENLRSKEITGQRLIDLFYWLRSLELGAVPTENKKKQELLEILRKLSIAYPSREDQSRITDVVRKTGLEAEFKPVTMREMNFQELMLHAKSQVREVDTLGALRTMRLMKRIEDQITPAQLWEAMEYHIKVLRILDERPQIPTILKYYLSKGRFLEIPKKSTDLASFMNRAQELAKYYWSYDDPKKSEEVLDLILETNKKFKTEYLLGPALAVKARIKEQARESDAAMTLMDEAQKYHLPEELRADLLWRKMFLALDAAQTSKDYKPVLALFDGIKKYSQKDPSEMGRWYYWYGRVLSMSGESDKAKEQFEKAYDSDSYSYYSNLGGLELSKAGDKPKKWRLVDKDDVVLFEDRRWSTPNWALYFKESGESSDPHFRDLARVYFLAEAGDWDSARAAFGDLDRDLWQRMFKKNISWNARREFMRTVSWTRLALKDPMGSLKAAEIGRQANGKDFEKTDLLSLYPLPYWSDIQSEADKRKVSPWLVASLIRQESAFNPRARSWANALGLMQMIPPVAKEEAKIMKIEKFDNEDLYQTPLALSLGTHHLSRLPERFGGSYICSIASYNAGWPPVAKWLKFYPNAVPLTFIERIPFRETQNYVKSILRNYMNYQRIYKSGDFDLDQITKMPENIASAAAAASDPAL